VNSSNGVLVLERVVDAPSDMVWKALTDLEALQKWQPYFTTFKAEVGFETKFELGTDESKPYLHVCEVTEVIKGRKLTYSWRYEGYAGDSYVTYELEPLGNKTKVILTHRITEPFPKENPDFAAGNFTKGWTDIINKLTNFMENTK